MSLPCGDTYVDFDCNGFAGLQASLKLTLLKNKLVLDSDPTQDVTSLTNVYFENFDDWLIELSVPSFRFKELDDFTFRADYIAFDRSASTNPEAFVFPLGYDLGVDPKIWEGFCLDSISVTLPPQFKKKGSDQRITIAINGAVIDKMGFTGEVSGTNLIPLEEGDMNGWEFSLEKLAIGIYQNRFQYLDFNGQLVVPVNKEDRPFAYTGSIDVAPGQGTNYFISVATMDQGNRF